MNDLEKNLAKIEKNYLSFKETFSFITDKNKKKISLDDNGNKKLTKFIKEEIKFLELLEKEIKNLPAKYDFSSPQEQEEALVEIENVSTEIFSKESKTIYVEIQKNKRVFLSDEKSRKSHDKLRDLIKDIEIILLSTKEKIEKNMSEKIAS